MATEPPHVDVAAFVEAEGWTSPAHVSDNWTALAEIFDPRNLSQWPWFATASVEVLREKRDAVTILFYGAHNPKHRSSIQSTQLPVLAAFVRWCKAEAGALGGIDFRATPPERVVRFVHARVELAHAEWFRRRAEQPLRAAAHAPASLYSAFRLCIPALQRLAKWQGFPLDLYNMENIQVLEERIRQDFRTAKIGAMDSAATSAFLTKRLQRDELDALFRGLWDGSLTMGVYRSAVGHERALMRAYISAALLSKAGKRGDDVRSTHLRMLFLHPFSDVGPAPCTAVGVSLRSAKDDDLIHDNEHLMGFIRSADRLGCPVTALANFLVWQNDRNHGIIPTLCASLQAELDFVQQHGVAAARIHFDRDPPQWYSIPLLFGQTPLQAASTSTHRKDTHASLGGAGIENKRKATHIFRYSTLGQLLEGGVSTIDAAIYQQWSIGVVSNVYARGCFNVNAMLKAHQWPADISGYACWWEGRDDDLPMSLKACVMVGLDEAAALANRLWSTHGMDRSAVEVCKVLKYLRRVFCEDAIVHHPLYPNFPAYRGHALFDHPEWPTYVAAERARTSQREAVWRASREHPEVAALIERLEERLLESVAASAPAPREHHEPVGPPAPPLAPWARVPDIPEAHPTDLAITYAMWADPQSPHASVASYFAETKRPAWTKTFLPEMMNVMKHRFHRQYPFWSYVDHVLRTTDHARGALLKALQAIADAHRVDAAVFVRQCFYYLCHPPRTQILRPPPVSPVEMIAALQSKGLPLPEGI